ncbi:MAG: DUF4126 domain-containing protein [Gemmatimonadaceae bacterium]
MGTLGTLAEALGIAYASGINLYATVAILGLAQRFHWVGALPGPLHALSSAWIIGFAVALAVVEFLATMIPGLASLWESLHTFIRPPAAALLAAASAWGGDDRVTIIAALLGGTLALGTHGTKLGLRYAIDTSPEPVTNATANVAELGAVTALLLTLTHHPIIVLIIALVVLVLMILLVRAVWRAIGRSVRQLFSPGAASPSA